MVNVTVTGTFGIGARPETAGPATIGNAPVRGTFAVTTAKRIDPSGHRTFTSVCVGSEPTLTADLAAPCGSARPNVAHPLVKLFAASICSSACAGRTTAAVRYVATVAYLHSAAHDVRICDSCTMDKAGARKMPRHGKPLRHSDADSTRSSAQPTCTGPLPAD